MSKTSFKPGELEELENFLLREYETKLELKEEQIKMMESENKNLQDVAYFMKQETER